MEKDFNCKKPLTKKEIEVLLLMQRGMTNREIARELFRSEATIKKHVEHILAKTNTRNRLQACAHAPARAGNAWEAPT